MILRVDLDSPTPPYEQVRAQIAALVDCGTLQGGERLPSIRQLAKDLGLASNTVQRAYKELEAGGHAEARGRHGTLVLAPSTGARGAESDPAVRQAAEVLAREAARTGNSLEDMLQIARVAFLGLPPSGEEV